MQMSYQTTIKPIGLIINPKMYVHGIPYIVTFMALHNIIINFNYSMLLGRLWFKDDKMTHDWGNNMIKI
jgi:hypothetical protein